MDNERPIHPRPVAVGKGELHRLPTPFKGDPTATGLTLVHKGHDSDHGTHVASTARIQDDVGRIFAHVDSVPSFYVRVER